MKFTRPENKLPRFATGQQVVVNNLNPTGTPGFRGTSKAGAVVSGPGTTLRPKCDMHLAVAEGRTFTVLQPRPCLS